MSRVEIAASWADLVRRIELLAADDDLQREQMALAMMVPGSKLLEEIQTAALLTWDKRRRTKESFVIPFSGDQREEALAASSIPSNMKVRCKGTRYPNFLFFFSIFFCFRQMVVSILSIVRRDSSDVMVAMSGWLCREHAAVLVGARGSLNVFSPDRLKRLKSWVSENRPTTLLYLVDYYNSGGFSVKRMLDELVDVPAGNLVIRLTVPYTPEMNRASSSYFGIGKSIFYTWDFPEDSKIYKWKGDYSRLLAGYSEPRELEQFCDNVQGRLLIFPRGLSNGVAMTRDDFDMLFRSYRYVPLNSRYAYTVEVVGISMGIAQLRIDRIDKGKVDVGYYSEVAGVGHSFDDDELPVREVGIVPQSGNVVLMERLCDRPAVLQSWFSTGRDLQPSVGSAKYFEYPKRLMDGASTRALVTPMGKSIVRTLKQYMYPRSSRVVVSLGTVARTAMPDVEAFARAVDIVAKDAIRPRHNLALISAQKTIRDMSRGVSEAHMLDFARTALYFFTTGLTATRWVSEAMRVAREGVSAGFVPFSEMEISRSAYFVSGMLGTRKSELLEEAGDVGGDILGYRDGIPVTGLTVFSAPKYVFADVEEFFPGIDATINGLYGLDDASVDYLRNTLNGLMSEFQPGVRDVLMADEREMMQEFDLKFAVDVPYFSFALPLIFGEKGRKMVRSTIQTELSHPGGQGFHNVMQALLKRNFNRPQLEATVDSRNLAMRIFAEVQKGFFRTEAYNLLALYSQERITVCDNTRQRWMEKHTEDVIEQAVVATLKEGLDRENEFFVFIKVDQKPKKDTSIVSNITARQTIVYHSKNIIMATVGVVCLVMERFKALLRPGICLFDGPEFMNLRNFATHWFSLAQLEGCYMAEGDVPGFDRSQAEHAFEYEMFVFEMMGVDIEVLNYWRRAVSYKSAFLVAYKLTWSQVFGRDSGAAPTFGGNSLVLLGALGWKFRNNYVRALVWGGDDFSIATLDEPEEGEDDELPSVLNFPAVFERVPIEAMTFASSVYVRDGSENIQIVPDPVKVCARLGKWLPLDVPARYFAEYFIGLYDVVDKYKKLDSTAVGNLSDVVRCRSNGRLFDVKSFLDVLFTITGKGASYFFLVLYDIHLLEEDAKKIDDVTVQHRGKYGNELRSKLWEDGELRRDMSLWLERMVVDQFW